MATRPVPRPGVLDIEAYVPGKSAAPALWLALMVVALALLALLWNLLH